MSGTDKAVQLQQLIETVDSHHLVLGTPGNFAASLLHPVRIAALAADVADAASLPGIPFGQAAVVESAILKSNAAGKATPSAASGNPTKANTPADVIADVLKDLDVVGVAVKDIQALEAGATATLNWWGWSLDLNESATQALLSLLKDDVSELAKVLAALSAISAPLAAAGAIVGAVSIGLQKWITDADGNKKGVTIDGYLWVGIWVTGN